MIGIQPRRMQCRLIIFQIFCITAIGLHGQKPAIGLTMDTGYSFYSKKINTQDRTLTQNSSSIINTGIFINYKVKNYLSLESVLGLNLLRRKYVSTDRIYNTSAPEIDLGEFKIYRDYVSNSLFLNFNLGFKWQKFKVKVGSQLGLVVFFQENNSQAINYSFISTTATVLNYRFKSHFLQSYAEFYSELNYSFSEKSDFKISFSFNPKSKSYTAFEPRYKLVAGLNSYFRNN